VRFRTVQKIAHETFHFERKVSQENLNAGYSDLRHTGTEVRKSIREMMKSNNFVSTFHNSERKESKEKVPE